MRVDLPDGAWAELRPPRKVNERRRRQFVAAMSDFQKSIGELPRDEKGETDPRLFGAQQQQLFEDAIDLLVVCLVSNWSFDTPIEANSISDFDVDVVDELKRACIALQAEVMPDYSPQPDPTVDGEKSSA